MEGKGRLLGWIAIGLGVVALLVALGGRHQQSWMGYGPQAPFAQQAPSGPSTGVAPRSQDGWPGWMGPRVGPGQQGRIGPQDGQGFQGGPGAFSRFAGPRHFGPWGFFFLPFMLIRGVARILLIGLLIFLALKFLARRRGYGGPWSGQGGPGGSGGPGQPSQPDPEKPPYTGETQNL